MMTDSAAASVTTSVAKKKEKTRVLFQVGAPGSGKSTAAAGLKAKYGDKLVVMSFGETDGLYSWRRFPRPASRADETEDYKVQETSVIVYATNGTIKKIMSRVNAATGDAQFWTDQSTEQAYDHAGSSSGSFGITRAEIREIAITTGRELLDLPDPKNPAAVANSEFLSGFADFIIGTIFDIPIDGADDERFSTLTPRKHADTYTAFNGSGAARLKKAFKAEFMEALRTYDRVVLSDCFTAISEFGDFFINAHTNGCDIDFQVLLIEWREMFRRNFARFWTEGKYTPLYILKRHVLQLETLKRQFPKGLTHQAVLEQILHPVEDRRAGKADKAGKRNKRNKRRRLNPDDENAPLDDSGDEQGNYYE